MRSLLAALRFLTILPLPAATGESRKDLATSLNAFPQVGILIAGFQAAAAIGLSRFLPQFPVAVLLTFTLVLVSGGLHLDGLADSADGLLSSRPREKILQIMRDSRVGPMGVMAILGVLLIKVSCLSTIDIPNLWKVAFLMPIAGRCLLVVNIACFPYARKEDGLGQAFYEGKKANSVLIALLITAAVSWLVAQEAGLIAIATALAGSLLFGFYTYKKLGGSTGDTLGAGCEMAEMFVALALVSLL